MGRTLGPAFVLFTRSYFAKVTLHKNVFFDLLHLIYSLPEEKRVKYANRISMSRFSFARLRTFNARYFSPPRHHFPFEKGVSSDETDAEPRSWIAASPATCAFAFAFARADRKNCSRGFENTMEINLPSLTNPEAHKAAGGTERRVNYIETSKSTRRRRIFISTNKETSRFIFVFPDIQLRFFAKVQREISRNIEVSFTISFI